MAPTQSDLTAAGAKPKAKRPISYFPLTTQGKIALAQWRAEHPKNKPREPPKQTNYDKPRSLLPPGELTEIDKLLNLRKTAKPSKSGWDFGSKKPITTQEKIQVAKAFERARGDPHGERWRIAKKFKIPSLLKQDRLLGRSYPRLEDTVKTNETTASQTRCEGNNKIRLKEVLENVAKGRSILALGDAQDSRSKTDADAVIPVMEFCAELRAIIWKFAVVNNSSFIWPASPEGRKQPNLALTCKVVRKEVLPIFYGCNTFGLSLWPARIRSRDDALVYRDKRVLGWVKALGSEREWLQMIKNWAFVHSVSTAGKRAIPNTRDESHLVLLRLPKGEGGNSYPRAEIHRQATCVLPDWEECGQCSLGQTPERLERLIDEVYRLMRSPQGIKGTIMVQLIRGLVGMKGELIEARCR